jgi:hypothetical protein
VWQLVRATPRKISLGSDRAQKKKAYDDVTQADAWVLPQPCAIPHNTILDAAGRQQDMVTPYAIGLNMYLLVFALSRFWPFLADAPPCPTRACMHGEVQLALTQAACKGTLMCKLHISNANFAHGWACMQNHMAFCYDSPSPMVNPSLDRWQLSELKTTAAGVTVVSSPHVGECNSTISLAKGHPRKAVHPLENSTHHSHTQHQYTVNQLRSTSLHSRKSQGIDQGSLRTLHKVHMLLLQWHWLHPCT